MYVHQISDAMSLADSQNIHLWHYFVLGNREYSGEPVQMHGLVWAFSDRSVCKWQVSHMLDHICFYAEVTCNGNRIFQLNKYATE